MSKQDLADKLARMSHFTNPPADVVADVLAAYEARLAELESDAVVQLQRYADSVSFQRAIRRDEQLTRNGLTHRHENEKRWLIKELGFAAIIRDRVMRANQEGRKTVKIDALLEGRPASEEQL